MMTEARYFTIPFPNDPSLTRLQGELRAKGINGEWQEPGTFHITLVYVPDVGDVDLSQIVTPPIGPFTLTGKSVISFPQGKNGYPIVLKLDTSDALQQLQRDLVTQCKRLGVSLSEYSDPDGWNPHITMCYSPTQVDPTVLQEPLSLYVDHLILGKEEYVTVQTYPLVGGPNKKSSKAARLRGTLLYHNGNYFYSPDRWNNPNAAVSDPRNEGAWRAMWWSDPLLKEIERRLGKEALPQYPGEYIVLEDWPEKTPGKKGLPGMMAMKLRMRVGNDAFIRPGMSGDGRIAVQISPQVLPAERRFIIAEVDEVMGGFAYHRRGISPEGVVTYVSMGTRRTHKAASPANPGVRQVLMREFGGFDITTPTGKQDYIESKVREVAKRVAASYKISNAANRAPVDREFGTSPNIPNEWYLVHGSSVIVRGSHQQVQNKLSAIAKSAVTKARNEATLRVERVIQDVQSGFYDQFAKSISDTQLLFWATQAGNQIASAMDELGSNPSIRQRGDQLIAAISGKLIQKLNPGSSYNPNPGLPISHNIVSQWRYGLSALAQARRFLREFADQAPQSNGATRKKLAPTAARLANEVSSLAQYAGKLYAEDIQSSRQTPLGTRPQYNISLRNPTNKALPNRPVTQQEYSAEARQKNPGGRAAVQRALAQLRAGQKVRAVSMTGKPFDIVPRDYFEHVWGLEGRGHWFYAIVPAGRKKPVGTLSDSQLEDYLESVYGMKSAKAIAVPKEALDTYTFRFQVGQYIHPRGQVLPAGRIVRQGGVPYGKQWIPGYIIAKGGGSQDFIADYEAELIGRKSVRDTTIVPEDQAVVQQLRESFLHPNTGMLIGKVKVTGLQDGTYEITTLLMTYGRKYWTVPKILHTDEALRQVLQAVYMRGYPVVRHGRRPSIFSEQKSVLKGKIGGYPGPKPGTSLSAAVHGFRFGFGRNYNRFDAADQRYTTENPIYRQGPPPIPTWEEVQQMIDQEIEKLLSRRYGGLPEFLRQEQLNKVALDVANQVGTLVGVNKAFGKPVRGAPTPAQIAAYARQQFDAANQRIQTQLEARQKDQESQQAQKPKKKSATKAKFKLGDRIRSRTNPSEYGKVIGFRTGLSALREGDVPGYIVQEAGRGVRVWIDEIDAVVDEYAKQRGKYGGFRDGQRVSLVQLPAVVQASLQKIMANEQFRRKWDIEHVRIRADVANQPHEGWGHVSFNVVFPKRPETDIAEVGGNQFEMNFSGSTGQITSHKSATKAVPDAVREALLKKARSYGDRSTSILNGTTSGMPSSLDKVEAAFIYPVLEKMLVMLAQGSSVSEVQSYGQAEIRKRIKEYNAGQVQRQKGRPDRGPSQNPRTQTVWEDMGQDKVRDVIGFYRYLLEQSS